MSSAPGVGFTREHVGNAVPGLGPSPTESTVQPHPVPRAGWQAPDNSIGRKPGSTTLSSDPHSGIWNGVRSCFMQSHPLRPTRPQLIRWKASSNLPGAKAQLTGNGCGMTPPGGNPDFNSWPVDPSAAQSMGLKCPVALPCGHEPLALKAGPG